MRNMKKRIRTTAKIQERAKELRKEATSAERILWERLRGKQLSGFKFRRQAPLGSVIADFYCAKAKLIIEIDGDIHDLQVEEDQQRTREIESFGYRVIRFKNGTVISDTESVLKSILDACNTPLPNLGEGLG